MGYMKHFQEKLKVKHTFDYPATKGGGSMTVEITEPLDFYLNIDTDRL